MDGREPSPLPERLRAKLPEILFEAVSIVFAVLLALGVDQWREERSQQKLAERARAAIVAEIRANRDQLREVRARNQRNMGLMAADFTAPDSTPTQLRGNMSWAQLSTAAWQTAQGAQATQRFDYDWLIRVARIYEGQALFMSTQSESFTHFGVTYGSRELTIGELKDVRTRVSYVIKLTGDVLTGYDELLDAKPRETPAN
jgi:hypothetical protein